MSAPEHVHPVATYRIRTRTHSDCEAVVSWVPDADALYLFTGRRLSWPLTTEKLIALEEPRRSAWMLVDDAGSPVGHVDLTVNGTTVKISRVLIDPEQRGLGLGHVLIQLAVQQAKALGATDLLLNVITGNEPAIRTYVRAGFTERHQSRDPDMTVMTRPV